MCPRKKQTVSLLAAILIGLVVLQSTIRLIEAVAFDDLPVEQREAAMELLKRAVSETSLDPLDIIQRGLDRAKVEDGLTASTNAGEQPAGSVATVGEVPLQDRADTSAPQPEELAPEPLEPEPLVPEPSTPEPSTPEPPAPESSALPTSENLEAPAPPPTEQPPGPADEASSNTGSVSPTTPNEPETTTPAPVEEPPNATNLDSASDVGDSTSARDPSNLDEAVRTVSGAAGAPIEAEVAAASDGAVAVSDEARTNAPEPTSSPSATSETGESAPAADELNNLEETSSPQEQSVVDQAIEDTLNSAPDQSPQTQQAEEMQSPARSDDQQSGPPVADVQESTLEIQEPQITAQPEALVPRAIPQTTSVTGTTTTTSATTTSTPIRGYVPRDEEFEDVFIDNSDPNDPKEVRIKNKTRIDGAGGVSHHQSRTSTSLRGRKRNPFKRRSSSSSFSRSFSNGNSPTNFMPIFPRLPALPPLPPIPPMAPMPSLPAMPQFSFPTASTWPGFYGEQIIDGDAFSQADPFGSGAFASASTGAGVGAFAGAGAGAGAGAFAGIQPNFYDYQNGGQYMSKRQVKKLRRKQERAARRAAHLGF